MSRELEKVDRDTKLTEAEVRERLKYGDNPAVTDEIHSFGKMMLEKTLDEFKNLDSKASAVAAYSIGIITLLSATAETWTWWLKGSAAAAFLSAGLAVWSLLLKKTDDFSQDEWLNSKHLSDIEDLRRYHIISIWRVIDSHQKACARRPKFTLLRAYFWRLP